MATDNDKARAKERLEQLKRVRDSKIVHPATPAVHGVQLPLEKRK